MKKQTHNNKEKGIVLLEAVVAVGVLVTIFSAAIALYIGAVGGLRMTNDQLIANYLAQDGMEQIIAKRQYNYDNDLPFLDGMDHCTSALPCSMNYFTAGNTLSDPLVACGADGCLLYLDTNGVYSSTISTTPSYFKRKVEITVNGHEAQVVVRVLWADGSKTFQVPVTYTLYNNPN